MEVICPRCGQTFVVPVALIGGIANCPGCGRAVEVPGRSEAMYWSLLGLGAAGVLAAAVLAFVLGGPAIGGTVLLAGLLVGAVLFLVAQ
ncbi:MAG TPA: hypothetical protein VML55_04760 [Planctomycetaceae bacterium]|nr:hypothetical protein [Planctomycetaceae bacterium]